MNVSLTPELTKFVEKEVGSVYIKLPVKLAQNSVWMKRANLILAVASGISCALFLILRPVSYHLSLSGSDEKSGRIISHDSIRLTSQSRCGISDGGIWFFSLAVPYSGSTRQLADERGVLYQNGHAQEKRDWGWTGRDVGFYQNSFTGRESGEFVGIERFGDFPGIYYRHFLWWKQSQPWWTLEVSLWYPVVFFALPPSTYIFRRRINLTREKTAA